VRANAVPTRGNQRPVAGQRLVSVGHLHPDTNMCAVVGMWLAGIPDADRAVVRLAASLREAEPRSTRPKWRSTFPTGRRSAVWRTREGLAYAFFNVEARA
jgi:hypothetical protein